MTKGILINYDYCTGCHSCEVACKKELGLPEGEFGIKLSETGPFEYSAEAKGPGRWEWTWLPVVTKACDMCESRTAKGKMPMCVQHCQAWCVARLSASRRGAEGRFRGRLHAAAARAIGGVPLRGRPGGLGRARRRRREGTRVFRVPPRRPRPPT